MARFSVFLPDSGISTLVIVARPLIPIDSQAKITMSIVETIHFIRFEFWRSICAVCFKNLRFYRVFSDVPIGCLRKILRRCSILNLMERANEILVTKFWPALIHHVGNNRAAHPFLLHCMRTYCTVRRRRLVHKWREYSEAYRTVRIDIAN